METAHRVRNICGQVFRYAVATGRAERNPAAGFNRRITTPQEKHRAAITEPKK